MKFNKKNIQLLFIIFVFGVPLMIGSIVSEVNFNDITISEYTADITINDSGDMNVVETWTMNYDEELRVRFRDIDYYKYPDNYPLYRNAENLAFFDRENVSVQIFKDNVDVTNDIRVGYSFTWDYDELHHQIACEPLRNYCESIFTDFEDAGGLEGDVTFVYDYTIIGAVTEYKDISELNWALFDYAESKVEKGEINIHLPSNTNSLDDYYIFSYDIKNTTTSIVSNELITISFEDMKTNDFLGFRLLMPTNLFDDIFSKNRVISNEIDKQIILDYEQELLNQRETGYIFEIIFLYIPILVVIVMAIVAYSFYKKYFMPYKSFYANNVYREIPSNHAPAVIGYLYRYKKTADEDITATILDLVRRDYLSLDDSLAYEALEDFDLIIRKNPDMDLDLLLPHEKYLIEWFIDKIGNGAIVTTKQVEEYGANKSNASIFLAQAKKFNDFVKHEANKNDFFDKKIGYNKKKAYKYVAIPIGLLVATLGVFMTYENNLVVSFITSVILIVGYLIFIATRKRRSKKGQDLYDQWLGYKEFLLDSEELKTYNMSSVDYWEHNIIYATTFGYADKVMDQLSINLPMTESIAEESKYLGVGYRHSRYQYGYCTHTIHRSYMKSYRASVSHQMASSSGGRSGGGGFSGGGGGGGRSR